jgi:hypothetical protein
MMLRALILALLLGGIAVPTNAQVIAQQPPITGITVGSTGFAQGRIVSVDLPTRKVTIETTDGRTVQGTVSPAIGGLDRVKPGDRVEAAYEERLSFVLSRPGTATPANRLNSALVTSAPHQLPVGVLASEGAATLLVVSTDISANKISLVNPAGGPIHTYDVTTPEGRSQLPRVKPGDSLTITFANYVFGAVTRKN